MSTKSKSLLAVMAVALMLGCGLVPAIADNGVAEETKDASSEATGVNNLADFLDIIENGAYAANLINFDGVLLKPVINDVRDAPQEIETDIYDEVHKTSGTWTIGDGNTISFHNEDHKEGTLYFDAGSTLVLFPMGGAQGFKIKDCYSGTGNDSLVILMPGSCLNIFGTTFMVLGTDEDNSIELFGFAKRSESDLTMNIQYDNQTDNKLIFVMAVKGDKVASAYINAFAADPSVNPDCGIIAGIPFILLSIDGKLSAPEKGYGFIISEASLTSITYGEDTETSMPMYKYGVIVAGITVNRFEYTYTVNDNEANGKISLDLTANGGVIATVSIMDEVQIMGSLLNFEFKTGDILFNISENPSTKRTSVSIAAKQSITLSSPECGLGVTIGTGFEHGVVVSDLKVSADNLSFSATGTDSGELIDLDASMSINGSYKGAHHTITVDGEEFYLMENDSSFTVGPISLTVEERTTTLNIEQMTVRGICNGATLRDFNVEYSGSLKNVVLTENKNSQTLRFDCDAYCRAVYNGKERVAKFAIENAVSSTTEDGAVFGIDTILLEKDIPNSIFEEKFVRYLKEVNIPDYIKFEVKNLRFDSEAADVIGVESMYVGMKNISVFNEVTVELNGNVKLVLKTDATGEHLDEVKCSEIKGTYKNITMPAAQKFSINNNPEVQVTNGAMRIIKGDARFGSGLVPMTIVVDKDASFTASELTANLVFVEGCKKSGQVRMILETIDGQTYSNSLICLDGSANITYMLTLADNGGYNVTVGLDKLTSGTVTAKKGFVLPAKYDGDGYSMKSDDGKTGSLNIADYGAKITIPTQRNSFTLSYENNFAESKTYRYLDTVTITQSVPEKEGMTFIGWTDGSRTGKDLIQPGDQYVMPARDVTLKPVYMKTVTPEVVKDGDKVILVVAESEANAIQIATDVKNWDVLEVKIKDVTVEMTKDTYDALDIGNGLGVIALSVDKFNNDYVENVIGNKKVYGIELMDGGDVISENSFNQKTEFKVTVNLKTDSSMKGFNVRYFDAEYGFFEDVGSTHTRNNDGTYDVTFTVNHFSLYAIEPVQENTVQNLFTLVAIIIVIILVCVAVSIYIANRKSA